MIVKFEVDLLLNAIV